MTQFFALLLKALGDVKTVGGLVTVVVAMAVYGVSYIDDTVNDFTIRQVVVEQKIEHTQEGFKELRVDVKEIQKDVKEILKRL